jgi:hypothetical protein
MARIWLGLVTAIAFVASAQAQTGVRAEMFDPGIYEHEVERTVEAPDEPSGKHSLVRNPKLIEPTTCIPAKRGSRFGVRYRITADQSNLFVDVRTVMRYPEPGLRDPKTNRLHEKTENTQLNITGAESYTGYSFDEDWEAMPGTWTIEIWHNETLMASQKFEVGPCFRGAGRQEEHPWRASGLG